MSDPTTHLKTPNKEPNSDTGQRKQHVGRRKVSLSAFLGYSMRFSFDKKKNWAGG
jgi:hypothetical protein